MILKTDRLYLVSISEEHFDPFCKMDMDSEVMHFIRKPAESREEAKLRFEKLLAYKFKFPGFGGFAVFDKISNEMVGIGFLIHIEMNPEYGYEVGYRFLKSAWGKGYATEISKELIRYGFEDKKLREIFATTNPSHKVSQKTLKKAGLIEIGSAPYHNGCTLFKITP